MAKKVKFNKKEYREVACTLLYYQKWKVLNQLYSDDFDGIKTREIISPQEAELVKAFTDLYEGNFIDPKTVDFEVIRICLLQCFKDFDKYRKFKTCFLAGKNKGYKRWANSVMKKKEASK